MVHPASRSGAAVIGNVRKAVPGPASPSSGVDVRHSRRLPLLVARPQSDAQPAQCHLRVAGAESARREPFPFLPRGARELHLPAVDPLARLAGGTVRRGGESQGGNREHCGCDQCMRARPSPPMRTGETSHATPTRPVVSRRRGHRAPAGPLHPRCPADHVIPRCEHLHSPSTRGQSSQYSQGAGCFDIDARRGRRKKAGVTRFDDIVTRRERVLGSSEGRNTSVADFR